MGPQPKKAKPAVDLNRSAVARYIQLVSLFRRWIDAGQWPVDQQTPTVDELAAECGVARATIRQALDQLAAKGAVKSTGRRRFARNGLPATILRKDSSTTS